MLGLAAVTFRVRQEGLRIVQIDMPIRMDVRHEDFPLLLQCLQQCEGLSVQSVHADPLETKAGVTRMTNDLLSQLQFGAMHLLALGNIRLFAARCVAGPFLRQIQSRIHQANSIPFADRAEDPDLTVVLLSQTPVPLARDADRLRAFLSERRSHQCTAQRPPLRRSTRWYAGHLIHHDAIMPRGVRQKILQHLIVAVGNRFGHALHIAFVRLHQAAQILLCRGRHAVISRAESIIERLRKLLINRAQLAGQFVIANPVFGVEVAA